MTVYVGDAKVGGGQHSEVHSDLTLDTVWRNAVQWLHRNETASEAKAVLWLWCGDAVERRFNRIEELASALEGAALTSRENYYFQRAGENYNLARVIHTSNAPTSSIGWGQTDFFQNLGHPRNERWRNDQFRSRTLAGMLNDAFIGRDHDMVRRIHQGLRRRAEQEYLLQNMVKGAIHEAAVIATRYQLGIAVRGTGLLAHMGIESGDPTKAQEFKNKTSKEVDLWLCDELQWHELGAVVHYDPRIEWTSQKANVHARNSTPPMFNVKANNFDWLKKWDHIERVRKPQLRNLGARINQIPNMEVLRKQFFKRSDEYMVEDYEYRRGHFALHTTLDGPRIRLKVRPDTNIVGDHDLFAFTVADDYGRFAPVNAPNVAAVQTSLQESNTFQAQHGGIWYWEPQQAFHVGIKSVIMAGHSPDGDEPLVYIQPGNRITAAYYIPAEDRLRSVWDDSSWTKWLETTHSGQLYLHPPRNDT